MRLNRYIFWLLPLVILVSIALTATPAEGVSINAQESEPVNIYFFVGEGCPYCEIAKPVLAEIANQDPRINLYEFEIYNDAENRELFFAFCEVFGIEPRAVPTTFIADRHWVGYTDGILAEMQQTIQTCLEEPCPDLGRDIFQPPDQQDPAPPENGADIITVTPDESAEENRVRTLPLIGEVNLPKILMIVGGFTGLAVVFMIVDRLLLKK